MNAPARSSVLAGVAGLAVFALLGAWLINVYVDRERQRDLLQWESRLGLVADAKADAVSRLLRGDLRDLDDLAGNASLQLYLRQVGSARRQGSDAAGSPEQAYLRNLLLAAADRYGYVAGDAPRIPANLPRPRTSGLALLDADLAPVTTTTGLADVTTLYGEVARRALEHPGEAVTEIEPDADGRAVLVYAEAIHGVLGTGPTSGAVAAAPVGVLVGVRSAEDSLFPLLSWGPSFAEDSETLLLARRGDSVVYLSPTRDGSPALRRSLPLARQGLAEAAAVLTPGGFAALANYRGQAVLQVSRQVRGQSWILVQQVDAVQALSEANERRGLLLSTLSMLLLAVVALAIAAWRHGRGVRAEHHAAELEQTAARLTKQTGLLHAITDNLDVLTLLLTRDGRILFANRAAAATLGRPIPSLVGSNLDTILAPGTAAELHKGIGAARERGRQAHELLHVDLGNGRRALLASFVPVDRIGEHLDLTLLVLGDVTGLERSRERHANLLRRLIATLARAVDQRDPHAGQHAARVAVVADAIAHELGLSDAERDDLNLSATLANIGKVMVPAELLTRAGPLAASEQAMVRSHVDHTLNLLKDLDFEGPVLTIIGEMQERLDGSGYPKGLAGEQISLPGRILAVANAFVAQVSARAYRQGMPVPEALQELLKAAGTRFDRRVVAALFHVVENRRDWSRWK